MAEHSFDIPYGPKLDGIAQTKVTLGELSGVQYSECLENAEKCIQVPIGADDKGNVITDFKLIASPTKMSMLVLRERVLSIGDIPAPIPDTIWAALKPDDINLMLDESDRFDDALLAVTQRGEHL